MYTLKSALLSSPSAAKKHINEWIHTAQVVCFQTLRMKQHTLTNNIACQHTVQQICPFYTTDQCRRQHALARFGQQQSGVSSLLSVQCS